MWQSYDRAKRTLVFHSAAPPPMERAVEDKYEDGFYRAGERVLPGVYRRIDGPGRDIILETEDILPASLDGHVAEYRRVDNTWDQITQRAMAKA